MIRSKPLTNWQYINNFAKDYFVKKICIVGTESTGKTTLAKQLAGYYNTVWAHELGRDIFETTKSGTLEDIQLVGLKHAENILRSVRLSNKLLFVDTDLRITKSYSEFLFGEVPKFEPWIEKANEMDLYIWLTSTTPYVDDGTRLKEPERKKLEKNHWKYFEDLPNLDMAVYYEDSEDPYLERFNDIVKIINNFISKY